MTSFKKGLVALQAFFWLRSSGGLKIRVHSRTFLFKYRPQHEQDRRH
jgi:hypothetical protein